jgi:transcriptional regulator with XRE-family HTH domain
VDGSGRATGLRAARAARGLSQTAAARELVALGRARGLPMASAASLKTLLSRWENGHALPEPQYRSLLGELYGRTPAELAITGPAGPDVGAGTGASRLRAAIARAAAAERAGPDLWWEQLAAARRLDDELGAAGAGELVRALVDQLDETLVHTPAPPARTAVAAVLAAAATLAGQQALDRGRYDAAWRRYDRGRTAAQEAGLPGAAAEAAAGQAAVLVEVDEVDTALALLDRLDPGRSDGAQVRLDAARGLARAAAGAGAAARHAMAAAESGLHRIRVDAGAPPDGTVVELADLHRWHGRALVALGDAGAAEPLRRALTAGPRSARDRAAVHADLALALLADRPEEAAEHARTARALATSIGFEQVVARLSGSRQGR